MIERAILEINARPPARFSIIGYGQQVTNFSFRIPSLGFVNAVATRGETIRSMESPATNLLSGQPGPSLVGAAQSIEPGTDSLPVPNLHDIASHAWSAGTTIVIDNG